MLLSRYFREELKQRIWGKACPHPSAPWGPAPYSVRGLCRALCKTWAKGWLLTCVMSDDTPRGLLQRNCFRGENGDSRGHIVCGDTGFLSHLRHAARHHWVCSWEGLWSREGSTSYGPWTDFIYIYIYNFFKKLIYLAVLGLSCGMGI